MTPTQIELHNAHKARLQRIAAAAARLNPRTEREFSAVLNSVENVAEPKPEWEEQQIERHKKNWFSIVSACKVAKDGSPTIRSIQLATCEFYGVKLNDLLSVRRTAIVMRPRQVSMYLAKELTGLSTIRIGRATGNRDHTTVIHAHRKVEKMLGSDAQFASQVAEIKARLAS
jgi:chromosomal replication initiation ATPase DnaA